MGDDPSQFAEASRLNSEGRTPKEYFDELYRELHSRARSIVRGKHRLDPTGPTSLVHEAFVRLSESEPLDIC
jgi:hypothetical protein